MSRPPQFHLAEALRNIDSALRHEDVRMPYVVAADLVRDLKDAEAMTERLSAFAELSVKAFEALEGLLANWPTTDAVGHYTPDPHATVLMKDEALKRAAEALAKYRDRQSDFVW